MKLSVLDLNNSLHSDNTSTSSIRWDFLLECIIFVSWILHFSQIYIQLEVVPMKYKTGGFLLYLLWLEGTVNSELNKY